MRLPTRALVSGLALTTALLVAGCEEEEEELTHGFVKLELRPAENVDVSIFAATAEVVGIMTYGECLVSFYNSNVNWASDGIDGGPVFGTREDGGEGWKDRLCEQDAAEQADCEILELTQLLDQTAQMRVRYAINDTNLEGRFLKFGPLPTQELAMCEGGLAPLVRTTGPGTLQGFDVGGNKIWDTETFDPSEAATNQGQAIRVRVGNPG